MKHIPQILGNQGNLVELIQNLPFPAGLIHPDSGEYVAVNLAMKQALGYGADASNLPPLLNPQQWQCLQQGETITDCEVELCQRTFSLSAKNLSWQGDRWIFCSLWDVTKYKKQALPEVAPKLSANGAPSHAQSSCDWQWMQKLLAHSPCILYIYDLNRQTFLYINRQSPPNFPQGIVEELQKCRHLTAGQTLAVDYCLDQGEQRWLCSWAVPFSLNGDGTVHHIAGVAVDITAHKQAELARQAILQALPSLQMRLRRDGSCVECLPPTPPHNFLTVQHHIKEILPPPLLQKLLQAIATALDTQSLQVYIHEIVKFGLSCHEKVYVMPAGAEEVLVVVQDISDRREIERRCFAVLSHEFRTPLSTILGSVQLLQHSHAPWLDDKAKRNLSRITLAVEDAMELLDNLLTLSRADAGNLQVKLQCINLRRFTEELVEAISTQRRIVVECKTSGEDYMGYVDPFLLRRILVNLLSNAIKYSPPDTEIKVVLWINLEQDQAIWQVIDRGIGIRAEDLPHIFTPWWRGSNAHISRGSGLGLSVVQSCVTASGGTIAVQSQEQRGTTFTVIIPITGSA